MSTKKFILLLLVVIIVALTIASTASAAKAADACEKALLKFHKVASGLSHSKATNPVAIEAHNTLLAKLLADIQVACFP